MSFAAATLLFALASIDATVPSRGAVRTAFTQQTAAAEATKSDEPSPAELRRRVLAAEDARDGSPAGIEAMLEALKSKDNETRRIAVRAMGRLERGPLTAAISQAIADPAPIVRAEAANALAQTANAGGDMVLASDLMLALLERESHPQVRGALALALGRLAYKDADAIRRAEQAIVATMKTASVSGEEARRSDRDVPAERVQFAPPLTLLGALRGMESLARLHAATTPLEPATIALLRNLAVAWRSAVSRSEGGPSVEAAARLRRLALAALLSAKGADTVTISTAFGDADDQVRRLATQAAAATEPLETKFIDRAIRDRAPMVRTAIVLALGQRKHALACSYATLVLRDPDLHVSLSAIDVAGMACATNAASIAAVGAFTNQLPPPPLPDADAERMAGRDEASFGLSSRSGRPATWHRAALALVALARLAPDQAAARLDAFAADSRWQVRMYAARAAALARSEPHLRRLSGDDHDNVRQAAVAGLRDVAGHAADDVYIAALERKDYQLLLTAARALEGTPQKAATATALAAALDRVSAEKRDTSRDPRVAFLERLAEVGEPALAPRLQPFVRDFDPVVAQRASAILSTWTGTTVRPDPQPLARPPLPTAAEVETLGAVRLVVRMREVGSFELRLLPQEAPVTALRVYRLVRERYYDGLTLHRVVPNFVLQGGSPGANEYMGDRLYLRDELGFQSHVRGSLGISTRGRDTGDAQIFINLVDNMRLDHSYTVFAQVERGIEVIDAVLETDVIERIEVRSAR